MTGAHEIRPRQHVLTAGHLYPQAWSDIEHMRNNLRGTVAPDWPEWCFIPIAGAQAAVANDAGIDVSRMGLMYPDRVADAARIAALAAWRMTQGIYRFDPAVYDAVKDTPVSGDIPHDVLFRLPEWCVYIETPGMQYAGQTLHGAFVHLEHDVHDGHAELRIVLDAQNILVSIPVHLGPWSLSESVGRMLKVAAGRAGIAAGGRSEILNAVVDGRGADAVAAIIEPIISLTLYLCSQASEIGGEGRRPSNPQPKKTKRGMRLFAPDKPTAWEVGVRMGAALRRAYQAEQTGRAGDGTAPRPHIRRAHWHGFRSGPMKRADGEPIPAEERRFDLRWLPPIPVNVTDDEMPAVVRPVK